jgi:hypothetical protein
LLTIGKLKLKIITAFSNLNLNADIVMKYAFCFKLIIEKLNDLLKCTAKLSSDAN